MRLTSGLTVALLLALPTRVAAQVAGTVRDAGGGALVAASVEGWGPSGRLFRVLTDDRGSFAAPSGSSTPVLRLTVELIGYRTTTLILPVDSKDRLSIRLAVEPIPLPELLVVASRSGCGPDADAVGRRLWERAAHRYSQETVRRGGAVTALTREGEIPESMVGYIDGSRLRRSEERWAGARWPTLMGERPHINERVLERGYVERRGGGWVYPHLGGVDASHFASAAFGTRHTFRVLEETENQTTVQFCPRSAAGGSVSGRLVLDQEGRLLEGKWIFKGEDATEDSGGQAVFAEFADSATGDLHLLAARGVFWRQMPGRHQRGGERIYFQLAQVFEAWFIAPDERTPPVDWQKSRMQHDHPGGAVR